MSYKIETILIGGKECKNIVHIKNAKYGLLYSDWIEFRIIHFDHVIISTKNNLKLWDILVKDQEAKERFRVERGEQQLDDGRVEHIAVIIKNPLIG